MADPISLIIAGGALAVSIWSARNSQRALRMNEEEHEQRTAERAARPSLGLEVQPSNAELDADGFIHTCATIHNVILRITVTNTGTKPAGRTRVAAWGPVGLDSTFDWVDAAGVELTPRVRPAQDTAVTLANDEGRDVPSKRLDHTLESVPLMGEAVYLRVPCPVVMNGRSSLPIHITAHTDGSAVETSYMIRLVHPG